MKSYRSNDRNLLFVIISSIMGFGLIFASSASAAESYVDVRNVNFVGEVVKVSSPNIVQVEIMKHGLRRRFHINLVAVDFGEVNNERCDSKLVEPALVDSVKNACSKMRDTLLGKRVSVEVTKWDQIVNDGFVFIDEINVNYNLIKKGWFRADYAKSRDAQLALIEKEARCQRAGIWESAMGNPEEDMKCQD